MPVCLDHNATTPANGRVIDATSSFLRGHGGNPVSVHRLGWAARSAIDAGRGQVAERVSAREQPAMFASGGTEANNLELAITSIAGVRRAARRIAG